MQIAYYPDFVVCTIIETMLAVSFAFCAYIDGNEDTYSNDNKAIESPYESCCISSAFKLLD